MLSGCEDKEKIEKQEAYRQIGINCMAAGEYEDAIAAFQNALDQSLATVGEREIDTCYYKAEAQYLAGYVEDAIETYTALIKYNKKNANAYFLRGSLYLKEGQSKKAAEDFAKVAEYNDKDYDLYLQMGEQLIDAGMTKEAKGYLEKGLELSGKSAEDYVGRGRIYLLLGDTSQAKEQFEKGLEKESKEASLYLGQIYAEEGDITKAQQMFEAYIKDNEGSAAALYSLASLEIEAEKYESAISHIHQALESEGNANEQELRRMLIVAYEKSGDFEQAKKAMEGYAEDYPDDEEAKRENEFLQTR